jgi:hypothetical protein
MRCPAKLKLLAFGNLFSADSGNFLDEPGSCPRDQVDEIFFNCKMHPAVKDPDWDWNPGLRLHVLS